jgi:hypothetical protein
LKFTPTTCITITLVSLKCEGLWRLPCSHIFTWQSTLACTPTLSWPN